MAECDIKSIDQTGLIVPELSPTSDPAELPATVFAFFQELWSNLGYEAIKTEHQDAYLIPSPSDYLPDRLITNTYSGLSDGQVLDRRPYLELYQKFHQELQSEVQLGDSDRSSDRIAALKQRLATIRANHLPDHNGRQGVQTYGLSLRKAHGRPLSTRQTAGSTDIIVSKTTTLQAEAARYGLPNQGHDTTPKPYPFIKDDWYNLMIERQPYYYDHRPTDKYDSRQAQQWLFWARGIRAAIDGSLTPSWEAIEPISD